MLEHHRTHRIAALLRGRGVIANTYKTIAVLLSTAEARDEAQSLLAQNSGAFARIVAPAEVATAEWVKQATRHCYGWTVYDLSGRTLDSPIELLALTDEIVVVVNEKTPETVFALQLPEAAEDLLWLALELGVKTAYLHIDGTLLPDPQVGLEKHGVPGRVAARKAQRAAFTRKLKEIRIYNDYCSSGLWEDGNLHYDLLDLPFPLVRRIAKWQQDFDDTVTPPDRSNKQWWERHELEEVEIARALQDALGPAIPVKVHRGDWRPIDEIDSAETQPPNAVTTPSWP